MVRGTRNEAALAKTIRVTCSDIEYCVRCQCRLIHGRITYRGQCPIHGPAQMAVYASLPAAALAQPREEHGGEAPLWLDERQAA